ncbi:MAG TPA: DUF6364 family protein [Hyphomicrobiales bacterium]|nr:DUF6364 family protein [Hyphomicrobiales bacterium]
MKNITLAVEENVLAAVRKYAAAHDTTVNALVRDYLNRLARQETRAKKAREELMRLAETSTLDLGNWKWNREELHDRQGLRGHEHSSVPRFAKPDRTEQKDDSGKDR